MAGASGKSNTIRAVTPMTSDPTAMSDATSDLAGVFWLTWRDKSVICADKSATCCLVTSWASRNGCIAFCAKSVPVCVACRIIACCGLSGDLSTKLSGIGMGNVAGMINGSLPSTDNSVSKSDRLVPGVAFSLVRIACNVFTSSSENLRALPATCW